MKEIAREFITAYWKEGMSSVFGDKTPKQMMQHPESIVKRGQWFSWKPIKGTLNYEDYQKIETRFGIKYPKNFIDWHKQYFFLDGDCSIVRLPSSSPAEPLQKLIDNLDWYVPEQLIPLGLIPFADDGNDSGPWVFDTRDVDASLDCPICIYDHEYMGDLNGLSSPVFSSFKHMMECLIFFLKEENMKKVVDQFYEIDPNCAPNWEYLIEHYS